MSNPLTVPPAGWSTEKIEAMRAFKEAADYLTAIDRTIVLAAIVDPDILAVRTTLAAHAASLAAIAADL